MANILIFKDLIDEVLSNPEQRFVLFGKPAQVRTPKNVYDLFYAFVGNTRFDNYAEEPDLVIPVLPVSNQDSKPAMYQLNRTFPKFTVFGTREARPLNKISGSQESLVQGLNLNFYELQSRPQGTEISLVPEYTVTTDEECARVIPDWENLNSFLRKERERISRHYI